MPAVRCHTSTCIFTQKAIGRVESQYSWHGGGEEGGDGWRQCEKNILARPEVVEHVGLGHHCGALAATNGDAEVSGPDSCSAPQKFLERKLAKLLQHTAQIRTTRYTRCARRAAGNMIRQTAAGHQTFKCLQMWS